jgi:hypothetical protein
MVVSAFDTGFVVSAGFVAIESCFAGGGPVGAPDSARRLGSSGMAFWHEYTVITRIVAINGIVFIRRYFKIGVNAYKIQIIPGFSKCW